MGVPATFDGALNLYGVFDLNGQAVTVTHEVNAPCGPCTGLLKMMQPSGRLTVGGFINFDGQSTDGVLTAGVLGGRGDFFVGGGTGADLPGAGGHKGGFDGAGRPPSGEAPRRGSAR